jgi:hypothetical protein
MKVFLGGTHNDSSWRKDLIKQLRIGYFNPIVKDWTPECMEEELKQREDCDVCLYVITPKMTGTYSIAEAVDDSNKRPHKTIFCVLEKDYFIFDEFQMRSLNQVKEMIKNNGAIALDNLEDVASYLNGKSEKM